MWGADRGYCLMIGGEKDVVQRLDPIFSALAPSIDSAPRTPGREKVGGTAEHGYLHCGPNGAGHFVKMVHNGIEYGIMAAYAEGLNILQHANVGKQQQTVDAETTPLRNPEVYQYDLNLADIAEVWRRGSVISSWLLDLTAISLLDSPDLAKFAGRVSDSGEGRWTITAAIDESVPAPVLSAALYERFSSRGEDTFADKLLSALRFQFGGHQEKRWPRKKAPDGRVAIGRSGGLRCHRRSGPQNDLPGALRDGQARHTQGSGHRRCFSQMESGATPPPRHRQHQAAGGIDDKRALKRLLSLLKYVNGDYTDSDTFTAIRRRLGMRGVLHTIWRSRPRSSRQ